MAMQDKSSPPDFVSQLQDQAKQQSLLHKKRLLPKETDWVTSFIGNYPWQVMLVLAIIGAVIWEIVLL